MTRPAGQPPAPTADPEELQRSLERLSGGPVVRRETHCSVVLLAGRRAYKLKKPVRFDFVDQRSLTAREAACRHELAVNVPMAPGIGLGVRSVVPSDGGYALAQADDPTALDYVVEMRRFDEEQTMSALAQRGALTLEHAARAGAAIAGFHARAARIRAAPAVAALAEDNLRALEPLVGDRLAQVHLRVLRRFDAAFAAAFAGVLGARAAAGLVVDGHGDLRAEHILYEAGRVLAVDRLEWDDLRRVDVADDLAFLTMDLESHGHGASVSGLLDGYVAAGGARPPGQLLAFFASYRAQVRAKVAWLRAAQRPDQEGDAGHGLRLLALARRLAWRARGPLLLLVTGPPASGKSTLARALEGVSGLPVVSSDGLRPRDAEDHADYRPAAREAVYRALAEQAGSRPAAIVDATFGERTLQEAFLQALAPHRELLVVECRAAAEVRLRRARERATQGASASEAGPQVAEALGARFASFTAVPEEARIAVDTEEPLDRQVDAVEAWLDARMACGTTGHPSSSQMVGAAGPARAT